MPSIIGANTLFLLLLQMVVTTFVAATNCRIGTRSPARHFMSLGTPTYRDLARWMALSLMGTWKLKNSSSTCQLIQDVGTKYRSAWFSKPEVSSTYYHCVDNERARERERENEVEEWEREGGRSARTFQIQPNVFAPCFFPFGAWFSQGFRRSSPQHRCSTLPKLTEWVSLLNLCKF